MSRKVSIRILLLILLFAALLVFLYFYRPPEDNILWRSISNTGHVPFFGLLSLIFLSLSSMLLRKKSRLHHYLLAFAGASLIGLFSEAIQILGPRDADLGDFLRDLAGILLFLGFYATFDRGLKYFWESMSSGAYKIILRIVTLLIFLSLISPPVIWSLAYLERNDKFPVICDFESYWDRMFIRTQQAEMEIMQVPDTMDGMGDDMAARITFKPGEYPGLEIIEPYPDWRGYGYFQFEVFSELDSLVNLALVIKDTHHNNEYYDRFNRRLVIKPGLNKIKIPLDEVKNAPRNRQTDMKNIASVLIFMYNISREYVLYLDDLELEQ